MGVFGGEGDWTQSPWSQESALRPSAVSPRVWFCWKGDFKDACSPTQIVAARREPIAVPPTALALPVSVSWGGGGRKATRTTHAPTLSCPLFLSLFHVAADGSEIMVCCADIQKEIPPISRPWQRPAGPVRPQSPGVQVDGTQAAPHLRLPSRPLSPGRRGWTGRDRGGCGHSAAAPPLHFRPGDTCLREQAGAGSKGGTWRSLSDPNEALQVGLILALLSLC